MGTDPERTSGIRSVPAFPNCWRHGGQSTTSVKLSELIELGGVNRNASSRGLCPPGEVEADVLYISIGIEREESKKHNVHKSGSKTL